MKNIFRIHLQLFSSGADADSQVKPKFRTQCVLMYVIEGRIYEYILADIQVFRLKELHVYNYRRAVYGHVFFLAVKILYAIVSAVGVILEMSCIDYKMYKYMDTQVSRISWRFLVFMNEHKNYYTTYYSASLYDVR